LSTALGAAVSRGRTLRDAAERAALTWPQHWFDSNRFSGLGLVRRHRPVLRIGGLAVVTRREDVLGVLTDPVAYPLPYVRRLPGSFVLGLTGEEFARQRGELSAVLHDEDPADLGKSTAEHAERLMRAAMARGGCDVGADLVHPVLDSTVSEYVGIHGPDPATQLSWARMLFQDIFLNRGDFPSARRRAEEANAAMSAQIDELIADRLRTGQQSDDLLGRLLRRRQDSPETALDDAEIRDSLIGLAIGWLWHGAKACLIAVDELLDRPDVLVRAREAARHGRPEELRRVLWEILRFRPVQPGVWRTCAYDGTIGTGTPRARHVDAGVRILVGTHSAMWDEAAVPQPARFDDTRADDQYLMFGAGPHRCLGERIMASQMPALLAPLLCIDGLARARGSYGYLRWEGATPAALDVRFPA
jgi:cytochrome P450